MLEHQHPWETCEVHELGLQLSPEGAPGATFRRSCTKAVLICCSGSGILKIVHFIWELLRKGEALVIHRFLSSAFLRNFSGWQGALVGGAAPPLTAVRHGPGSLIRPGFLEGALFPTCSAVSLSTVCTSILLPPHFTQKRPASSQAKNFSFFPVSL